MGRVNVALYVGQSSDTPHGLISIPDHKLVEVSNIIRTANVMYDNQYLEEGTIEERIDYVIEAVNGAGIDVENLFTSADSHIYL